MGRGEIFDSQIGALWRGCTEESMGGRSIQNLGRTALKISIRGSLWRMRKRWEERGRRENKSKAFLGGEEKKEQGGNR